MMTFPYQIDDAYARNPGFTLYQAKQWMRVANSAYDSAQQQGASPEACAEQALQYADYATGVSGGN